MFNIPRVVIFDGKRRRAKRQLMRFAKQLAVANGFQVEVYQAEDLFDYTKHTNDDLVNAVVEEAGYNLNLLNNLLVKLGTSESVLQDQNYFKSFRIDKRKFIFVDREYVDGFVVKARLSLRLPIFGTLPKAEAGRLELLCRITKLLTINTNNTITEDVQGRASIFSEMVINLVTRGEIFEHYDNPRSASLEAEVNFVHSILDRDTNARRFITLSIG